MSLYWPFCCNSHNTAAPILLPPLLSLSFLPFFSSRVKEDKAYRYDPGDEYSPGDEYTPITKKQGGAEPLIVWHFVSHNICTELTACIMSRGVQERGREDGLVRREEKWERSSE